MVQQDAICPRLVQDLCMLAASDPADSHTSRNDQERVQENVQAELQAITLVLEHVFDEEDKSAAIGINHHHEKTEELLAQFLTADLPTLLVSNLTRLDFEVKKDVINLFSAIMRLASLPWADRLVRDFAKGDPAFFQLLIEGYSKPEVATHCGIMLRYCARQQHLVEFFFANPDTLLRLVSLAQHDNFDISSDAFSTLHDFLLVHKTKSSAFLEKNFSEFFPLYNHLLMSDDYVTQRQALKLLSETLLDRSFSRVMIAYVGDVFYLQLNMKLLLADSNAIQFEAFQIFKVFAANPRKPPRVQHILHKNKDKLVDLLQKIRSYKEDDKQFSKDMATVLGALQAMQLPLKVAAGKAASGQGCCTNLAPAQRDCGPSLIMGR